MKTYTFAFLDGECFWGGSTVEGCANPYTAASVHTYDFTQKCFNQTMPLFLSNKGRYIWSERPFTVTFAGDGTIRMEGEDVQLTVAGTTLREPYLHTMRTHFPFDGKHLPEKFFTTAQYNTWMEFTYHPTQAGVLDYAHSIVDHGFEPGILIIDEGWHGRYGNWEFDRAKFPDPKAMMDELHALGFTVMLWVVPLVCPDGQEFVVNIRRDLNTYGTADEIFTRNAAGEVAVARWWNGLSAILDLRKQVDRDFLDRQLCPMMQFSPAPWRLLSDKAFGLIKEAAALHKRFAPTIVALVKEAEITGEPVLRNLEYNDPGKGYEHVMDEFMLGEDILVCPVVTPGTLEKDLVFPTGTWVDEDGIEYVGGQTHHVKTPLEKLKFFTRRS